MLARWRYYFNSTLFGDPNSSNFSKLETDERKGFNFAKRSYDFCENILQSSTPTEIFESLFDFDDYEEYCNVVH